MVRESEERLEILWVVVRGCNGVQGDSSGLPYPSGATEKDRDNSASWVLK